jgi:hypothetical protein
LATIWWEELRSAGAKDMNTGYVTYKHEI